jgi:hypothetical protein
MAAQCRVQKAIAEGAADIVRGAGNAHKATVVSMCSFHVGKSDLKEFAEAVGVSLNYVQVQPSMS